MWSRPRRGLAWWIYVWGPVVLAIAVICIESTEMMGADRTSGPLRAIYQFFFGHVPGRRWEMIHNYIRKSGHFIGYGLVGLSWLRAWWFTIPQSRFLQDSLLAMAGTALVAAADEYHQSFLPNRTSSAWDVLLDCCGALTMQLIVYTFMRLVRPKRLRRAA
jgi:VanZ family protein